MPRSSKPLPPLPSVPVKKRLGGNRSLAVCSHRPVPAQACPAPPEASSSPIESHNDTQLVLQAVRDLFRGFLRKGYGYSNRGVSLLHDPFHEPTNGNETPMSTLDAINRKFGRKTAGFAESGWKKSPVR